MTTDVNALSYKLLSVHFYINSVNRSVSELDFTGMAVVQSNIERPNIGLNLKFVWTQLVQLGCKIFDGMRIA